MATISRRAYAEIFGPTVGDRIRLADTDLVIEVEEDYTLRAGGYGEEVKFGGGKTIRDGMAQSQRTREQGAMDTVLTNALILDHWGIVKADIGLKDGRIAAIGKAGNPDTQPGVDIVIGPGTEIISCEGAIVTGDGLVEHCRGQLAKFKVPKDVIFIDALPRNPSGKVLKRELRLQLPSTFKV